MASPASLESTPELTNRSSASSLRPLPMLTAWIYSSSLPSSRSSAITCHEKIPKSYQYNRAFTHLIEPCGRDEFNAVKVRPSRPQFGSILTMTCRR